MPKISRERTVRNRSHARNPEQRCAQNLSGGNRLHTRNPNHQKFLNVTRFTSSGTSFSASTVFFRSRYAPLPPPFPFGASVRASALQSGDAEISFGRNFVELVGRDNFRSALRPPSSRGAKFFAQPAGSVALLTHPIRQ